MLHVSGRNIRDEALAPLHSSSGSHPEAPEGWIELGLSLQCLTSDTRCWKQATDGSDPHDPQAPRPCVELPRRHETWFSPGAIPTDSGLSATSGGQTSDLHEMIPSCEYLPGLRHQDDSHRRLFWRGPGQEQVEHFLHTLIGRAQTRRRILDPALYKLGGWAARARTGVMGRSHCPTARELPHTGCSTPALHEDAREERGAASGSHPNHTRG